MKSPYIDALCSTFLIVPKYPWFFVSLLIVMPEWGESTSITRVAHLPVERKIDWVFECHI